MKKLNMTAISNIQKVKKCKNYIRNVQTNKVVLQKMNCDLLKIINENALQKLYLNYIKVYKKQYIEEK